MLNGAACRMQHMQCRTLAGGPVVHSMNLSALCVVFSFYVAAGCQVLSTVIAPLLTRRWLGPQSTQLAS